LKILLNRKHDKNQQFQMKIVFLFEAGKSMKMISQNMYHCFKETRRLQQEIQQ
jgi:hypothetical protein